MLMTATKSASIGVPGYSETYAREGEASRRARALVGMALRAWGLRALVEDAESVVAELVANAVQHGGGRLVRVRVDRVAAGRVRVAVSDTSRRSPVLRHPSDEDTRGRGLLLVSGLADRWGTDPRGWGKVVWAELTPD